MGDAYYAISDILAEETLVPVTFQTGARGLGKVLDQGAASADVQPEARLELPLWLAATLSERQFVSLRTPRAFGRGMQRRMHAGAGCENLRVACAHFYEVAAKLHAATGDDDLGRFALDTFRARYKELLTQAHSVSAQATTQLQGRLSAEELALFEGGRQSVERFDRWRARGVSALPHRAAPKRKAPPPTAAEADAAAAAGRQRNS